MSDRYEWRGDDPDLGIVLRHQPATAVYLNPYDQVVIRQEDAYGDDDDVVIIAPANVMAVVEAMLAAAGIEVAMVRTEEGGLAEPPLLPKPTPLSNAERQRRYRQRQRNGNGDALVTENDKLPLRIVANGHQQELAS